MRLALHQAANADCRPRLADVCPAFRDKLREFNDTAPTDAERAACLFKEAQMIAQAFWLGVDYACGVDNG